MKPLVYAPLVLALMAVLASGLPAPAADERDLHGSTTPSRLSSPDTLHAKAKSTPRISAPTVATTGSRGLRASVPSKKKRKYKWTILNGALRSGKSGSTVVFDAGRPGSLTLICKITDPKKKSQTSTQTITLVAAPVATIAAPTHACLGQAGLKASVPSQNGCGYAWRTANGQITAGDGTSSITYTAGSTGAATDLTCTVTNAAGMAIASSHRTALDPGPTMPTIGSFTATPSAIAAGQSATLAWNVSDATDVLLNGKPVTGRTMKVSPVTSTVYTLVARKGSQSCQREAVVAVTGVVTGGDPGFTLPGTAPIQAPVQAVISSFSTAAHYTWFLDGRQVDSVPGPVFTFVPERAGWVEVICQVSEGGQIRQSVRSMLVTEPSPSGASLYHHQKENTFSLGTRDIQWAFNGTGKHLDIRLAGQPTGTNFLQTTTALYFTYVHEAGIPNAPPIYPSGMTLGNGLLTVVYGNGFATATFRITAYRQFFTIECVGLVPRKPGSIASLCLFDGVVNAKLAHQAGLSAIAMAMNADTNMTDGSPSANVNPQLRPYIDLKTLTAPPSRMIGAKVAIVIAPTSEVREVMKAAIHGGGSTLPYANAPHATSLAIGPWALDAPACRESYLVDNGDIKESSAGRWLELAQQWGLKQVYYTPMRSGDFSVGVDFPSGMPAITRFNASLKAAGVRPGLHTYSMFIHKQSRYVHPIPDPRLASTPCSTLASGITANQTAIAVVDPIQAVPGLGILAPGNYTTLRIEDELIVFKGVTNSPAPTFTTCERGAHGTIAKSHPAGAPVRYLKEFFKHFAPDPASTLLLEVADNLAAQYNAGNFEMLYLDALEGFNDLYPNEEWFYTGKFLDRALAGMRPTPIVDVSQRGHHIWLTRSRIGVLDASIRSQITFLNKQVALNKENERTALLPTTLGWFLPMYAADQSCDTYREFTPPETIHHLYAMSRLHNIGLSLMAISPDKRDDYPHLARIADIAKAYEESNTPGAPATQPPLPTGGDSVAVDTSIQGSAAIQQFTYRTFKWTPAAGENQRVETIENPFDAQSLGMLRIQVRPGIDPAGMSSAPALEPFTDLGRFVFPATSDDKPGSPRTSSALVTCTARLEAMDPGQGEHKDGLRLEVVNNGSSVDNWAEVWRRYDTPINVQDRRGLGVWIRGDGSQAVVNIQTVSSAGSWMDGYADHFVRLDYTGWKLHQLVETEGGRVDDLPFPHRTDLAGVYMKMIDYKTISTLRIQIGQVPAHGRTSCLIGPIMALPLKAYTLDRLSLRLSGTPWVVTGTISSGDILEYSGGRLTHYDRFGGTKTSTITPGEALRLAKGSNALQLEFHTTSPISPRFISQVQIEKVP